MARRKLAWWLGGGVAVLTLGIGAFPAGRLRGIAADRVSAALGTRVEIGALTRTPWFSYAPTITLRDVRIAQPAWAGPGDLVRLRAASFEVPLLVLATGDFRPERALGIAKAPPAPPRPPPLDCAAVIADAMR